MDGKLLTTNEELKVEEGVLNCLYNEVNLAISDFERRSGIAVTAIHVWPDHPDNAGKRLEFKFGLNPQAPF